MEEKQLHKHIKPSCDTCEFYDWDDDMDDNVCIGTCAHEDEYVRMMESPNGPVARFTNITTNIKAFRSRTEKAVVKSRQLFVIFHPRRLRLLQAP